VQLHDVVQQRVGRRQLQRLRHQLLCRLCALSLVIDSRCTALTHSVRLRLQGSNCQCAFPLAACACSLPCGLIALHCIGCARVQTVLRLRRVRATAAATRAGSATATRAGRAPTAPRAPPTTTCRRTEAPAATASPPPPAPARAHATSTVGVGCGAVSTLIQSCVLF
jgi:hypothetical protein